jgi:hypothetical protein
MQLGVFLALLSLEKQQIECTPFFFQDEKGDWWTVSSDYNSPAVQPITTWVYRRASKGVS